MKRFIGVLLILVWISGCANQTHITRRVMMTNPRTGEWQYLWYTPGNSPTWAGMAADSQLRSDFLYAIEAMKMKGFTNVQEVK